jgi:hypothetical protein
MIDVFHFFFPSFFFPGAIYGASSFRGVWCDGIGPLCLVSDGSIIYLVSDGSVMFCVFPLVGLQLKIS